MKLSKPIFIHDGLEIITILILDDETAIYSMDAELRRTSDCFVVEKERVREAKNWIEIHNGKIGTFFEAVNQDTIKMATIP